MLRLRRRKEAPANQPTSQPATAAVVVVGIIGMTNNKEVYQVSETIQSLSHQRADKDEWVGMAVAVVGLWKLFKLLFPSTDCWGFQLQVSLRGGSAGWLAQPRDGCWWYFRRAPLTDNINVE